MIKKLWAARPTNAGGWLFFAFQAGGILLLTAAAYSHFVLGPRQAKQDAADAIVIEEVAESYAEMAGYSQGQTIKHYETTRNIDRTVERGLEDVYSAPASSDSYVDPELDAAGRRALCLFDTYRSANNCDRLLEDDHGAAAEANTFG